MKRRTSCWKPPTLRSRWQGLRRPLVRPKPRNPEGCQAVCHAWGGRDSFAEGIARRLAAEGYLACALDAYGAGVRGTTPEENQALMAPLVADRAALFRRLTAGLEALRAQPNCGDAVAAIGYCFGGLCVLDLARGGAGLRVVSPWLLHAPTNRWGLGMTLDSRTERPRRSTAPERRPRLRRGDDPSQGLAAPRLRRRPPRLYRAGGQCPGGGVAYHPKADRRSWASATAFLREVLTPEG